MNDEHDYEAGLREGRLKSLEDTLNRHGERLDDHSRRLTAQEKINYAILGALALLEVLPTIRTMLENA